MVELGAVQQGWYVFIKDLMPWPKVTDDENASRTDISKRSI